MKLILASFLMTCSLLSFGQTTKTKICVDDYEGKFPGKLQIVMDQRIIVKVFYGENDKFTEIEKFEPNPQNKYFRGGSEYFIRVQTAKKAFEGKLNLTTMGELQLWTDESSYFFTCN